MKSERLQSSGLIPSACVAVSATGSRRGKAMDCLRDKRLYLPSLRQVEGPYILLQGRRYLVPKRPIREREKGDQRRISPS
jgi:hypothetical protein